MDGKSANDAKTITVREPSDPVSKWGRTTLPVHAVAVFIPSPPQRPSPILSTLRQTAHPASVDNHDPGGGG
jgi:hypothetical protein